MGVQILAKMFLGKNLLNLWLVHQGRWPHTFPQGYWEYWLKQARACVKQREGSQSSPPADLICLYASWLLPPTDKKSKQPGWPLPRNPTPLSPFINYYVHHHQFILTWSHILVYKTGIYLQCFWQLRINYNRQPKRKLISSMMNLEFLFTFLGFVCVLQRRHGF